MKNYLREKKKAAKALITPREEIKPKEIDYPHIDRVGIELEGAWKVRPKNIKGDESIKNIPVVACKHTCHCIECFPGGFDQCRPHNIGEVVSDPINPKLVNTWVPANYPDAFNETCALHAHVSTKKPNDYLILTDKKFYAYFLKCMEDWGKANLKPDHIFWKRLRGENRFCLRVFSPDAQMKVKQKPPNWKDRRTHLNYCHGIFGTLECRLFPMFEEVELAVSAIHAFLSCVNTYIEENPLEMANLSCEIVVDTTPPKLSIEKLEELVEVL